MKEMRQEEPIDRDRNLIVILFKIMNILSVIMNICSKLWIFVQNYEYLFKIMNICSKLWTYVQNYEHMFKTMNIWIKIMNIWMKIMNIWIKITNRKSFILSHIDHLIWPQNLWFLGLIKSRKVFYRIILTHISIKIKIIQIYR